MHAVWERAARRAIAQVSFSIILFTVDLSLTTHAKGETLAEVNAAGVVSVFYTRSTPRPQVPFRRYDIFIYGYGTASGKLAMVRRSVLALSFIRCHMSFVVSVSLIE